MTGLLEVLFSIWGLMNLISLACNFAECGFKDFEILEPTSWLFRFSSVLFGGLGVIAVIIGLVFRLF